MMRWGGGGGLGVGGVGGVGGMGGAEGGALGRGTQRLSWANDGMRVAFTNGMWHMDDIQLDMRCAYGMRLACNQVERDAWR